MAETIHTSIIPSGIALLFRNLQISRSHITEYFPVPETTLKFREILPLVAIRIT